MPGDGLQEEQDAVLIRRHPKDQLLEIPQTTLAMDAGDGDVVGVKVVVSTWRQCVA